MVVAVPVPVAVAEPVAVAVAEEPFSGELVDLRELLAVVVQPGLQPMGALLGRCRCRLMIRLEGQLKKMLPRRWRYWTMDRPRAWSVG